MIENLKRSYFAKSLSKDEIVLSYEDSIEFIKEMENNLVPIVAWEGWIKYPSGKVGHSEAIQGTASCLQKSGESTEAYMRRANNFARSTIESEWIRWQSEAERKKGTLFFCFTIDETIGCPTCSAFASSITITKPNEYFSVLNGLKDLIKNGKMELVSGNCNLEDVVPGSLWPDDVINHIFKCIECGSKYELSVETYHGSGGGLKKIFYGV